MSALVKPLTWLAGVILLLVGILGFFQNPILGTFEVNTLHNLVHLVTGAAGLIAAGMGLGASRSYLIIFGLVYLVVTVLGFLGISLVTNTLMVNGADNYLHLAIAAVYLLVGFGSKN